MSPNHPRATDDGLEIPARPFAPELRLPWTAVLGMTRRASRWQLAYIHPQSGKPVLRILGATGGELDELAAAWHEHQLACLERDGCLEGGSVPRDTTPGWLLALLSICGLAVIGRSLYEFWRTLIQLWPTVVDLPGDAKGWFLFSSGLYAVGGVLIAGLVCGLLWRRLADARTMRQLAHWRLDRKGLYRRDAGGAWQFLGPQQDDRLGPELMTVDGVRYRHTLMSGQPLSGRLLRALAQAAGARIGGGPSLRRAAWRLLAIWLPLLASACFLAVRFVGIEEPARLLPAALLCLLVVALMAGALLVAERLQQRALALQSSDESELLEKLR